MLKPIIQQALTDNDPWNATSAERLSSHQLYYSRCGNGLSSKSRSAKKRPRFTGIILGICKDYSPLQTNLNSTG